MLTTLKKAALVGLGFAERAKELVDELAKRGEASQSEEARRVRSFFETAEKGGKEFGQKCSDVGKRIAGTIRIPSRADIERLEKELADLTAQFHRWEAGQQGKGDR
ncbi:MAG: hypothetical protein WAO55_05225 [Candidatus Manganitrophaceae bacterium]